MPYYTVCSYTLGWVSIYKEDVGPLFPIWLVLSVTGLV